MVCILAASICIECGVSRVAAQPNGDPIAVRNAGSTESAFAPRKHARSRSERRLSPEVIVPAFLRQPVVAAAGTNSDIWTAAKAGNLEAIDQHLADGADVNQPDPQLGVTPLSWAAIRGHTEANRKKTAVVLRQHGAKEGREGLAILIGIILLVVLVALAIGLAAAVVACLVLSSALKALPEEHRQVESWQLWLLTIPCFNLVWNFFVFPKVSRSYESYFRSMGRTDVGGASQVGWCYCICSAASLVPSNQIAGLAGLVLLIIYLVKINGYRKQIVSGDIAPNSESPSTSAAAPTPPPAARRHDLDALRAIAMLAGIALHGALSFFPLPWPVQDSRQSEWFGLLIGALHGFRMPLFFLLSGFFTAMLWRRRGLRALISHRFRRVFLPCMLGLSTVVPAVNAVSLLPVITAPEKSAEESPAEWASRKLPGLTINPESEGEVGLREQLWGVALLLMYAPIFHHLWFLWFLCWLVAAFAVFAAIADRRQWRGPPKWLILSPIRYLWLLPLTMIPQMFMGYLYPTFGPDTSSGILPAPHILLYYAIFFGFGALYYDTDDETGRVGRWWWLALPIGLLVLLPLGLDFTFGIFGIRKQIDPSMHRPIANILQVSYAWLMTFGCMGLFRKLLSRESRTMRYVSDSSYWLYVAHVPLIIAAQMVVQTWPLPAIVKFVLVCVVVSALLLFTYQKLVRYTWLGALLNGPRKRPERATRTTAADSVGSQP